MRRPLPPAHCVASALLIASLCGCDGVDTTDDGSAARDAGSRDASFIDATAHDGAADADAAGSDAGPMDAGSTDAGSTDASTADANLDAAAMDAGPSADADTEPDAGTGFDGGLDAGSASDAGPPDAGCPDPGGYDIVESVRSDSASVGTPDTYFYDTIPCTPFSASITGGGSGTWSVVVSNGTSSGVYCSGDALCEITVPPGQTTLLVTAVTTDIGSYTLRVSYAE